MNGENYPVIYFFSSKHCAPCREVEETLKRVNISMFGKKLFIQKIDIEESHNITKEYKITAVPTLIIADKRLSLHIQEEDIVDAILYGFISSIRL
ncbi:MAG: thioredoxin family protein [Promethearchaeota archaeon]